MAENQLKREERALGDTLRGFLILGEKIGFLWEMVKKTPVGRQISPKHYRENRCKRVFAPL